MDTEECGVILWIVVLAQMIQDAPTIDPESLRPVSEWELTPDRWTCEWFRCKTCHHLSCCADPFCGGCGAKMKNAGASTDDLNEPKEETFDMR